MSKTNEKFTPDRESGVKKQSKFKDYFKNKVVPSIGKLGNQTHLSALRDAFGTMIPFLIAGSIGLLSGFIIFGTGGTGRMSLLGLICKVATGWDWEMVNNFGGDTAWAKVSEIGGSIFSVMSDVTIGAMSIYFAWLFGYFIAIVRKIDRPFMVGFISLASFWIANMGQITWSMGAQGLLTAIIFGILSSEFFIWLSKNEKLKVRLPEAVPDAIGKSFSALIPVVFTLGSVAIANVVVLAPALASTGWAVTAQESIEISVEDFEYMWTLDSIEWTNLIQTDKWREHSLLLEQMQNLWGGDRNVYIDWFDELSNQDKSIITSFTLTEIFNENININSITEGANSRLVIIEGEMMGVFSYQGIVIDSSRFGLGQALFQFFTSWFIGLAMSEAGIGIAIIGTLFSQFFWFFGVHGANIMSSILDPIGFMVTAINIALFSSLGMEAAILTGEMGYWGANWSKWFVDIGGSGATLPLIISTFIFSRRREYKELAKYSTPAGLFGINEPVIFGWPLVLNGVYAIPFIFAPFLSIFPYFVFGQVLRVINPPVLILPWTTPSILGAIMANLDWRSIIPFAFSVAIQFAVWTPFIFIDNKLYFKKLKLQDFEKYEIEMRYLKDKDYRNSVKAEIKEKKEKRKEKLKARKIAKKNETIEKKKEKNN